MFVPDLPKIGEHIKLIAFTRKINFCELVFNTKIRIHEEEKLVQSRIQRNIIGLEVFKNNHLFIIAYKKKETCTMT